MNISSRVAALSLLFIALFSVKALTQHPIVLRGYVAGGLSISGNTATFSLDVTSGAIPISCMDIQVSADMGIIGGNINFVGREVEVSGEMDNCTIYVNQPSHYIRVLDGPQPPPPPPPPPQDSDGDGIPDTQDQCPYQYGSWPTGCPQEQPRDSDHDGIPDNQDQCPYQPGQPPTGCPREEPRPPDVRVEVITDRSTYRVGDTVYITIRVYVDGRLEGGASLDDVSLFGPRGSQNITNRFSRSGSEFRASIGADYPGSYTVEAEAGVMWSCGIACDGYATGRGSRSYTVEQGADTAPPSAPQLISPRNGVIMPNGSLDQDRDMVWNFDWSDSRDDQSGVRGYQIVVWGPNATVAAVDTFVSSSNHTHRCPRCYVASHNLNGWTWKVRAQDNAGNWSSWSETWTFSVEPPSGGNQPPQADFTWSPSNPQVNQTIQFTDRSTDPDGYITSWRWDFGGRGASTAQHPGNISFTTSGNFNICLTVTDNRGASNSTCRTIQVSQPKQPPVARASANPTSGNVPLSISFSSSGSYDPDGSIVSYQWNFGDGSTSTQSHPSYTYQRAGTYTATLTVKDNDGLTASATVTITVSQVANKPPKASFTWDPHEPYEGQTVKFTDRSTDEDGKIVRWFWEFIDDGGTSNSQNPSRSFQGIDPDDYGQGFTVCLTVWDDDGAASDRTCGVVIVLRKENKPPVAKASANPTSGNAPLTVNFSSNGSYDPEGSTLTYQWDFGDGSSSSQANPSHTYQNQGTYTAKLTVKDKDGLTGSAKMTIIVKGFGNSRSCQPARILINGMLNTNTRMSQEIAEPIMGQGGASKAQAAAFVSPECGTIFVIEGVMAGVLGVAAVRQAAYLSIIAESLKIGEYDVEVDIEHRFLTFAVSVGVPLVDAISHTFTPSEIRLVVGFGDPPHRLTCSWEGCKAISSFLSNLGLEFLKGSFSALIKPLLIDGKVKNLVELIEALYDVLNPLVSIMEDLPAQTTTIRMQNVSINPDGQRMLVGVDAFLPVVTVFEGAIAINLILATIKEVRFKSSQNLGEAKLNLHAGWNSIYISTTENLLRSTLNNKCGDVVITTYENGKLVNFYGSELESDRAYLIRISKDCEVTLQGTVLSKTSLQLSNGWNFTGAPVDLSSDAIYKQCANALIVGIDDQGKLESIREGQTLRAFKGYLIRTGQSCTVKLTQTLSANATHSLQTRVTASTMGKDVVFQVLGRDLEAFEVQVFDLSGQQVYSSGLVQEKSLHWTGDSQTGRLLANGVYLYVVTMYGKDGVIARSSVQKVMLLR